MAENLGPIGVMLHAFIKFDLLSTWNVSTTLGYLVSFGVLAVRLLKFAPEATEIGTNIFSYTSSYARLTNGLELFSTACYAVWTWSSSYELLHQNPDACNNRYDPCNSHRSSCCSPHHTRLLRRREYPMRSAPIYCGLNPRGEMPWSI